MTAGGSDGGSNLERRYRSLLRVLPAWYRAEREEEMVGILLAGRDDDLDREHGRPGWGEAGATLAPAVRVRLGRRRAAGTAVRLPALTGLLGQVVAAAQSWTVLALPGGPDDPPAWWYDALVVVAFAALVAGRRAVGRVAAGLSGVAGLVAAGIVVGAGGPVWPGLLWQVPVLLTAAAAVAGFHREAPAPSRRWWAAGAVATAAGAAPALVTAGLSAVTLSAAWGIAAVAAAVLRPWTAPAAEPR
ncbi:hypothetical protein ACIGNX_10375 [Actinosynnema sp. NPDC053489]|uniref:hypothetical protein n=1 Tax=Actinosynnema sp. NPDC053489 TaxID=3363916 RepID=UPI0037C5DC80